jgi:hypothetical protein
MKISRALVLSLLFVGVAQAYKIGDVSKDKGFNIQRVANVYRLPIGVATDAYYTFMASVNKDLLSYMTGEEIEELFMQWLESNLTRQDILKQSVSRNTSSR